MSTFSTELDPFIVAIKAAAENEDFGPSYLSTNFGNASKWTEALLEMMVAELADAVFDQGGGIAAQQAGIKTAVKTGMQRVWTATQKQTYTTGGIGGQAPSGVQH